jgi:hypothetical protein|tara:strand:+ start:111 stop:347 length:237 start_codon:yes stop_codon:yes gene_type:complete
MAWVTVPGTSNIWQYENTATASNTYSDSAAGANSTISGGIRTYTKPGTSSTVKTYIRCRKTGTTVERGELSKTYYDGQ